MMVTTVRTVCALWIGSIFLISFAAAEWPTYRADAARSGYSAETLPARISLSWTFDAPSPLPAWPRSGRLPFDRAHHCVIAGNSVFFGSSADHSLYRLDADTGRGNRIFTCDGPIRFAPTIWRDRLFLVSDDGFLYCLSFDGEVIWKHRGGPSDSRRLGNEQLISKWPARGAPTIVEDTVYYAAGIWPTDEIFVYALNCDSGETVWVNDDSGGIYMPQPHGGADAESGVSAQGYLVASSPQTTSVLFPESPLAADAAEMQPADSNPTTTPRLLVPTGRAVPAAFQLSGGKFEYFHLQQYGQRGGFATMAIGPMFFNSGIAFDAQSGKAGETLGAGPMAAMPGGLVRATDKQVVAYRWVEKQTADRRGQPIRSWGLVPQWTADGVDGGTALVVAGQTIVAGGENQVTLLDAATGETQQTLSVTGNVYGLSISGGRLIVSTDTGQLFAFAAADESGQQSLQHSVIHDAKEQWAENASVVATAEAIIEQLDSDRGYCLDFGCGDGQLAYQLAMRSGLRIYGIDFDAEQVAIARKRLQAAGVYGSRVTILHFDDLASIPLPNYFANVIVSQRSIANPDAEFLTTGWQNSLRPYGGRAFFGPSDQMRSEKRGPLENAGQWTHQYMSAANELCSDDERLEGPLGMLWYRDIDVEVPQRHGRPPAPLFYDGLLYHEGIDEIVCVDAYNGTEQWRYSVPGILKAFDGDELMGVSGTGSNFCVGDSGVYIRHDDYCLRIDRQTGELLGKFLAPKQVDGEDGTWGYLALEHGTLYGSLANRNHVVTYRYRATGGDMSSQLTESSTLFALDPESGEMRWRYDADQSIRHNAIAVGDDQVFLIDRALAEFDRTRDGKAETHPPGVLVALDARTGQPKWRNEGQIDGTTLSLSPKHRSLLMSYQPTRFALASEIGGRLSVFSTEQGDLKWSKEANYSSRPMINDYTIYAQGGAWDLFSGEERPFNFSRSYGCGILAGSRHMMVYRSATLGYFDLLSNEKTANYGGMRPGCWINALPAGGLVLVPDASAGCVCSYLNQAWIALEPVGVRPPRIEPAGGVFSEPVDVQLSHDDPNVVVRYTLDGSSPSIDSPTYREPLNIDSSLRIRVRAFGADGQVSTASDETYRVDPNLVPLADSLWRVWDISAKATSAPSNWSVDGTTVRQRSNIFLGSATDANPDVERYATLRIFEGASDFSDGEIELEFRSSDDDGVGLAFRLTDENHHYLWSTDLQRKYRVLAIKEGDDYRVLAKNANHYQKNAWQHVKVILRGDQISIEVDGEQDFSVQDDRFSRGTIALHSWGSDNVEFRNIVMRPLKSE